MSQLLSVSRFTIVEALEILKADGLIESQHGRGYYIKNNTGSEPIISTVEDYFSGDIVNTLQLSMVSSSEQFKPGCGFLPESWLPTEAVRLAFRQSFRNDNLHLSNYGDPLGNHFLREVLRLRVQEKGMQASVNQIVTTNCTLNSIDLLFRALIKPRDTILIDDPSYFNLMAIAKLHQLNIVTFPRVGADIDIDLFERLVKTHKPKIYLTCSVAHNPTGHSYTADAIYSIVNILDKHGCHLIEDDLYGDVIKNKPFRMTSFFGFDNATYIGGYSKLLTANTRTSFILSNPSMTAKICQLKRISGGLTSDSTEESLGIMLKNSSYDRHLRKLHTRLIQAKAQVSGWLLDRRFTLPVDNSEGLFLWARCPAQIDSIQLATKAHKEHIILAPGILFSQNPNNHQYMRFNIAQTFDPIIQQHINTLL